MAAVIYRASLAACGGQRLRPADAGGGAGSVRADGDGRLDGPGRPVGEPGGSPPDPHRLVAITGMRFERGTATPTVVEILGTLAPRRAAGNSRRLGLRPDRSGRSPNLRPKTASRRVVVRSGIRDAYLSSAVSCSLLSSAGDAAPACHTVAADNARLAEDLPVSARRDITSHQPS